MAGVDAGDMAANEKRIGNEVTYFVGGHGVDWMEVPKSDLGCALAPETTLEHPAVVPSISVQRECQSSFSYSGE